MREREAPTFGGDKEGTALLQRPATDEPGVRGGGADEGDDAARAQSPASEVRGADNAALDRCHSGGRPGGRERPGGSGGAPCAALPTRWSGWSGTRPSASLRLIVNMNAGLGFCGVSPARAGPAWDERRGGRQGLHALRLAAWLPVPGATFESEVDRDAMARQELLLQTVLSGRQPDHPRHAGAARSPESGRQPDHPRHAGAARSPESLALLRRYMQG
eukprot:761475-Hanusia_phi.AAC.7